jgi:class 3 adenylate cyclase
MADINAWLESLGLMKYREVFASNDIDLTVAPELTERDLEELGLSLGHRRKFVAAAAKLRPGTAMPADAGMRDHVAQQVQRRHVTVVFTHLVDSTALASQLDPEDLDKLLRSYRDACTEVMAKFDGYVAQFLGDGVLAYFGFRVRRSTRQEPNPRWRGCSIDDRSPSSNSGEASKLPVVPTVVSTHPWRS